MLFQASTRNTMRHLKHLVQPSGRGLMQLHDLAWVGRGMPHSRFGKGATDAAASFMMTTHSIDYGTLLAKMPPIVNPYQHASDTTRLFVNSALVS